MKPVAFITGAGRRIGHDLAIRFAEHGWDVAIHCNTSVARAESTAEAVRRAGCDAIVVRADVRHRTEIDRAVDQAVGHFGRLDLLVNNAGIYPPAMPLLDVDEEMWREVLETNLYGEFFAAQAAARVMLVQEQGGRIVNLASLGSFQIWRERIAYNVSKGALIQLTRALARALAPTIAVNAVAPGVISIPDDPAKGTLMEPTRIPMRRHGSTNDIFRAVWFFAVDALYVTGQVLLVDGGLSIAQESSQE